MSEDRKAVLAEIAEEVRGCTLCDLHKSRTHAVPGYGDPNADIMFIGEAPGFHEDKQGLPFVGRSGQYLDYLLAKINLERSQVFITNVVKCRPPENRDPNQDEIDTCHPYLQRQIEIIQPLVIATLGRFSMNLFFPNAKITQIHGKPKYADGRAYYPFFHPAAALRNPNLRQDMEDDMTRLPEILEEVRRQRQNGSGGGSAPAGDDRPPTQLSLF